MTAELGYASKTLFSFSKNICPFLDWIENQLKTKSGYGDSSQISPDTSAGLALRVTATTLQLVLGRHASPGAASSGGLEIIIVVIISSISMGKGRDGAKYDGCQFC